LLASIRRHALDQGIDVDARFADERHQLARLSGVRGIADPLDVAALVVLDLTALCGRHEGTRPDVICSLGCPLRRPRDVDRHDFARPQVASRNEVGKFFLARKAEVDCIWVAVRHRADAREAYKPVLGDILIHDCAERHQPSTPPGSPSCSARTKGPVPRRVMAMSAGASSDTEMDSEVTNTSPTNSDCPGSSRSMKRTVSTASSSSAATARAFRASCPGS